MRGLFGALFGLLLGLIVGALLKNNLVLTTFKEIISEPCYLALIGVFVILGWILGITSFKNSDNNSTLQLETFVFIFLAVLGAVVIYNSGMVPGLLFIIVTELLWILLWLIKHDKILQSKEKDKRK